MANIKEKASVFAPLTRRGFVKAGTITGLAAAAGGFSLPFSAPLPQSKNSDTHRRRESSLECMYCKLWKPLPITYARR